MSYAEQLDLIRNIRKERRSFAPAPAKVKKASAAKANNMAAMVKALSGLSPEELQLLLGEE